MANPDVFALRKSGLDPFLFAEVGTELNGSALTILSVLGRLGFDPWAEAGRWNSSSTAVAIDGLAQSIAKMPLSAEALVKSRDTASRLVLLLPAQTKATATLASPVGSETTPPNWIAIAALCGIILLGMALSVNSASRSVAPLTVPTNQNVGQ
jgi:hypothetical protein